MYVDNMARNLNYYNERTVKNSEKYIKKNEEIIQLNDKIYEISNDIDLYYSDFKTIEELEQYITKKHSL
jgi:DNA-binding protein H-NS